MQVNIRHPFGQPDIVVPIPDGWHVVEFGNVQVGDRFMAGGRHNAWAMRLKWLDVVEGSDTVGRVINPEALIIRKSSD